jgi:glutathione S-transferase
MANLYQLSVNESEQDFNEVRDDLLAKFDPLEHALVGPAYFNGGLLSLVDASYAPLLQRLEYIDELTPGLFDATRHPKICAWKNSLLKLEAVRESCLPEIRTLYLELLWKRRGYVSTFLDKTKYRDDIEQSIY